MDQQLFDTDRRCDKATNLHKLAGLRELLDSILDRHNLTDNQTEPKGTEHGNS